MRVIVADAHALFRESLECFLEEHGHEVVGLAADGPEAIELARRERPDLLLAELSLSHADGVETARRIASEMPEVKVVILADDTEDPRLLGAIQAGALGLVLKGTASDRFLEMLEAAARGEPVLPARLTRRLLTELRGPNGDGRGAPAAAGLTPREVDVLRNMVDGHTSNVALAERLQVSENTVKFHVRNILGKLRLRDRAQVVAYAVRNELVDLPPRPGGARVEP